MTKKRAVIKKLLWSLDKLPQYEEYKWWIYGKKWQKTRRNNRNVQGKRRNDVTGKIQTMQIIKVIEISTAKRISQGNWLFAVFWYGIAWKCNAPRCLLAPPLQRWPPPPPTSQPWRQHQQLMSPRDSYWNAIHRKRWRCTLTRRSARNTGPAQPARWSSSTKALVQLNQEDDPAGSLSASIKPYIICMYHYVSLSLLYSPLSIGHAIQALTLATHLRVLSVSTPDRVLQKVKINRKREGRGKWCHFFIVKLLFTCFIFSHSYSTLVKRTWQLLKSK